MRAPTRKNPAFTWIGALTAVLATCEILAGLACFIGVLPVPSGFGLIATLVILCGSVFPVVRLTMPNGVRSALVLGIIFVVMAIAAKSDLFGIKNVDEKVSEATKRTGGTGGATSGSTRQAQAEVDQGSVSMRLRDGNSGSSGWAQRINETASQELAASGGSPVVIAGTVELARIEPGDRLSIAWSIEWGGATEQCGVMTIFNTKPEIDLNPIVATFRSALSRSEKLRRPTCN